MKHFTLVTLVTLLLVSCSIDSPARGVDTPASKTPLAHSPRETDAYAPVVARQVDLSIYQCVCNGQDRGVCQTVYVVGSEASWYVNFQFQGVTILKRAKECKPLTTKQERQS